MADEFPREPHAHHEMITVYHMDGDELVAVRVTGGEHDSGDARGP